MTTMHQLLGFYSWIDDLFLDDFGALWVRHKNHYDRLFHFEGFGTGLVCGLPPIDWQERPLDSKVMIHPITRERAEKILEFYMFCHQEPKREAGK